MYGGFTGPDLAYLTIFELLNQEKGEFFILFGNAAWHCNVVKGSVGTALLAQLGCYLIVLLSQQIRGFRQNNRTTNYKGGEWRPLSTHFVKCKSSRQENPSACSSARELPDQLFPWIFLFALR